MILNLKLNIKIDNWFTKIKQIYLKIYLIYLIRNILFYYDIEKLKKLNLEKSGNLIMRLLLKDKILNKNGLRNDLEFVNHKIQLWVFVFIGL